MWTTIGIIIVICSLFAVFFRDIDEGFHKIVKVLWFIPSLLIGIVLIAAEGFIKNKKERVGYIAVFLVVAFIVTGFIFALRAGPSSPAPWE